MSKSTNQEGIDLIKAQNDQERKREVLSQRKINREYEEVDKNLEKMNEKLNNVNNRLKENFK